MQNKHRSFPWFTIALCLAGAWSLFGHVGSKILLNYYQDDAFYYFQIARNIATHHGSTFDGIHSTNGYHPLWMLTLASLNFISTGRIFFVVLQLITLVSFIVTFLAARTVFRYFSKNDLLTELAAAVIALQSLLLIRSGMEVTLTLPLALLLCCYRLRPQFRWTPIVATGYGLLAALVILSRLDSVIFIALLFLLELLLEHPATLRELWPRACALLCAIVPFALYIISNQYWFHVWMPISGEAKQLRLHHGFTFATLRASFGPIYLPYRVLIIYPTLLVILLCIIRVRAKNSQLRRDNIALSLSLIALPFLQLFAFATTSDWPIWTWYLYSFPLALTGAFLLLFNRYPNPQTPIQTAFIPLTKGVAVAFAFLLAAITLAAPANSTWFTYGQDIEIFSRTHGGIYAMGDSAGTPGYLIREPLIQLEGLVMDAPFLDNIRRQRNLNEVLASYNVHYYITLDAKLINGCYNTLEPIHAGPDSPHMRGSFCQAPIASFPHGNVTVNIFDLTPSH